MNLMIRAVFLLSNVFWIIVDVVSNLWQICNGKLAETDKTIVRRSSISSGDISYAFFFFLRHTLTLDIWTCKYLKPRQGTLLKFWVSAI